jgi:hypothetical protein
MKRYSYCRKRCGAFSHILNTKCCGGLSTVILRDERFLHLSQKVYKLMQRDRQRLDGESGNGDLVAAESDDELDRVDAGSDEKAMDEVNEEDEGDEEFTGDD